MSYLHPSDGTEFSTVKKIAVSFHLVAIGGLLAALTMLVVYTVKDGTSLRVAPAVALIGMVAIAMGMVGSAFLFLERPVDQTDASEAKANS